MMFRLVLLFVLLPLAELALLMYVHSRIGLLWTIALVLGTAIAGAALAKHQGLRAWRRMREEVAGHRLPGGALLDGFLILVAGVLLITPGLLTDALGLTLLFPPTRNRIKRRFWMALRSHAEAGGPSGGPGAARPAGEPEVIDTEFTPTATDDSSERKP
ncbi:MAG: FxsA family protein [Planctomycetaceae bacterium]